MLWLLFAAVGAVADDAPGLRALLMPGPLSAAHAKYTNDCKVCHESFRKKAQDNLCLDCHEAIAADVREHAGFHGRIGGAAPACGGCHAEHLGRDARITRTERAAFDHARTDFPLEGAHRVAECGGCHRSGSKLRDAPHACIGCHREDDRHQGAMGEKCADCHGVERWKDTRFDHASTHFALEGKHEKVACDACHPDNRYRDTPTACHACHARSDAHKGRRGEDCDTCHAPAGWSKIVFDHDRDTKFPLRGGHDKVGCVACHHEAEFKKTAGRECAACHRGDDAHAGRNGSACADCHDDAGWKKVRFDHARDADFPLHGAHAKVACAACHPSGTDAATKPGQPRTACTDCHRQDDVHDGAQGRDCTACHDEERWANVARFDHELAAFPLLGMHATVDCGACHLDRRYGGTATECDACHAQDDVHDGHLGRDCATCHNPSGWKLVEFDHDRQTDFPLDGAHRELACADCHAGDPGRGKTARDCVACHRGDDRHRGNFGPDCGKCHVSDDWSRLRMGR